MDMSDQEKTKTLEFNAAKTEGGAIVALLGESGLDDPHAETWARAMQRYLADKGWAVKEWGHWERVKLTVIRGGLT